ncbi:SMP-30/gluconolactonase/LRE family protein [Limnohabitans sp. Rim8]|uniref:SMP-30/gluconolactonase/LRE family protein n=1 Tax=Limnohabitans sp. Rim8 TaxID=1100718 RepID=UPI0025D2FC0C|nr:SMP-30/gluconolactonase/LRE family protein [Limnohabitans sp. Rim8]
MNAPAQLTATWTAITTEPDGLSESPFWHPQEQRLYWVDIPGRRIARLGVQGLQAQGSVDYWPLTQEPGCIAPVQGGGWVMALRNGIYMAHEWGGNLQLLAAAPYDTTRLRFNDGKCDAQGRFWAGSLYEPKDQALSALYMLDGQGLHAMVGGVKEGVKDGVVTANGLAWSPDGRTAYWADTAAHQVRAFDFDAASGQLGNPRVFYQAIPKPAGWAWGSDVPYGGRPDGAVVDSEGCYWSAQYEGGRLLRLSTAGDVLAEVKTPVPCPTMPCFGGEDLKTLFITTSRQGRSAQELAQYPGAGCVWGIRVEVAGLAVNGFG